MALTLTPGTRLGPYEILSELGAGGMGEVYRATDTTLNRQVAIKVLLPDVATDPDRLARFGREAQVLASLNHQNIAHLHGLENVEGVPALVMELVEGPTLADRITAGALPPDEALSIARQIAEALEAAHAQGIIHRDLKPANVKVRPDGTVKVLDFGLAKASEPIGAAGAEAMLSPTLTLHATRDGIILGTAAYMSPEQARGRAVDKRTDIWAFGVVLYELLTGQSACRGDDVSATLAFVITKEPDWDRLPATTPVSIRRLLRRCLEKDPKKRVPDIGVARLEIDEALAPAGRDAAVEAATGPQVRRAAAYRALPLAAVALFASGAGALATWGVMRAPVSSANVTRFAIMLPDAQALAVSINDRDLTLSPDGTHLVYTAGPQAQLMVHALDQLDARPLAGVANARAPFASPDGRWIGFFNQLDEGLTTGALREGDLRKVSISGGPPMTLCRINGGSRGASWAPDNTIVFATNDTASGLLRVSAGGGEATVLTSPDGTKGEEDHHFPSVLPGGRGVLFSIVSKGQTRSQVAVLDLRTGQYKTLVREGTQAEYVETGHLVYVVAGTLWAVRFNLTTLDVVGDPVPIAEPIMATSAANFSASRGGALAYVPRTAGRGSNRSLVWVSRDGTQVPTAAPPRAYDYPRLSPDGSRVTVRIREQEWSLWTWDFARESFTRLTPDGVYSPAIWTRDGRSVIFSSGRLDATSLFRRPADGTGADERLTAAVRFQMPMAVSADGKRIVYQETLRPESDFNLMLLSLDGAVRTEPLVQTPSDERSAEISPDGRWLAYESNESRRSQIYVRPFPNVADALFQISTDGGRTPLWAPNGRELLFVNGSSLMSVAIQLTPGFLAGNPVKLFDDRSLLLDARSFTTGAHRTYDVARDGQRFLMMRASTAATGPTTGAGIVVVQNWLEELKRLVPAH